MPSVKTTSHNKVKPDNLKPKKDERFTCVKCGRNLKISNFYKSTSSLWNAIGHLGICKDCVGDYFDHFYDIYQDVEKAIYFMCLITDAPFIQGVFEGALTHSEKVGWDVWRSYFKQLNSLGESGKYPDSFMDGDSKDVFAVERNLEETNSKNKSSLSDDEMTECKNLFGHNFKDNEYVDMWKKYHFIKNNYPGTTNLHIEHLTKYCIYGVKEEHAIAANDIKSAKDWGTLRQKAATDAKLNISQLSKSDLQGGLNSFSEYSRATEEAVDIIKILPEFKYRPNDAADFIIWCYVNYLREAEGKPTVEYREIYSFYDKKKDEYIKQYGDPHGIFENDPTESNRENIEKFITIPKDMEDE